ncbi:tyrosine--tRNA ligase [Spiroplasma endosymbiont of Crioceris asparagi]|uniref:tyrosine--tRNA ligase n=1 Tax=Spiroplasma endosymbiont of Crioceris asparagi TaxID=3066286 RepID=UPI0030CFB32B
MKNILDELEKLGVLKQFTNKNKIIEAQKNHSAIYCGFDPTADSLHIGHLIQIVNLIRFQNYGFKPIALIGGATGMIGDPSFKSAERVLLDNSVVKQNTNKIQEQIKKLIPNIQVVDNAEFYKNLNVLDFLRDVGKSFNISYLLNKENIASRISNGLSFTEFTYTLLQGYDFYNLYKDHNCMVQLGGSDQWGNITSGIDFIASSVIKDSKACGITFNLLTKKDGQKFGKSESGTIWIDINKTNEYELYQFLINQDDDQVEKLICFLTTLELKEIKLIMDEHKQQPFKRLAQKRLASEVVKFVYGKEALQNALEISEALFKGNIIELPEDKLLKIIKTFPHHEIKNAKTVLELLVETSICSSNREARELIKSGAISINNLKIEDNETIINNIKKIISKFYIIKKGKKNYYLVF